MMAKIFVLILAAFSVISAQASPLQTSTCKLTVEELEKYSMECLAHDPALLIQVLEHMKDLSSLASLDFVCQNTNAVVDLLVCLEDKYATCFSSVDIKQYLPNHEQLAGALKLVCEHKKDLVEGNCMNQDQIQDFLRCYVAKVGDVASSFTQKPADMKTALCSIVQYEESCLSAYHGKCSSGYVNIIFEILKQLFSYCPALVIDMKNQAMSDAMGNFLLHGAPLRFQPSNGVQYKVETKGK